FAPFAIRSIVAKIDIAIQFGADFIFTYCKVKYFIIYGYRWATFVLSFIKWWWHLGSGSKSAIGLHGTFHKVFFHLVFGSKYLVLRMVRQFACKIGTCIIGRNSCKVFIALGTNVFNGVGVEGNRIIKNI